LFSGFSPLPKVASYPKTGITEHHPIFVESIERTLLLLVFWLEVLWIIF